MRTALLTPALLGEYFSTHPFWCENATFRDYFGAARHNPEIGVDSKSGITT
jgi:hypothetical protein